jgi:hypothetical protein
MHTHLWVAAVLTMRAPHSQEQPTGSGDLINQHISASCHQSCRSHHSSREPTQPPHQYMRMHSCTSRSRYVAVVECSVKTPIDNHGTVNLCDMQKSRAWLQQLAPVIWDTARIAEIMQQVPETHHCSFISHHI